MHALKTNPKECKYFWTNADTVEIRPKPRNTKQMHCARCIVRLTKHMQMSKLSVSLLIFVLHFSTLGLDCFALEPCGPVELGQELGLGMRRVSSSLLNQRFSP